MDNELLHAFTTLNSKIDDHYQLIDKKIEDVEDDIGKHNVKIQKICDYINVQKETKTEKKENSNRKFYIIIAILGTSFALVEIIQSIV